MTDKETRKGHTEEGIIEKALKHGYAIIMLRRITRILVSRNSMRIVVLKE